MFCRSATPHPAHGLLCQRGERRSNHLLHLPEIQPGMENPHPQPIYTSSLTSPPLVVHLTLHSATTTMLSRPASSQKCSSERGQNFMRVFRVCGCLLLLVPLL